jgi:pimeloyl-ACP methyl ester carboxylesterase
MTLACDRSGAGVPLVLLHGIGSARQDWAALAPRLAPDFDVLALDLPGHGDSAPLAQRPTVGALTDAVEADLDARGLATVHVLGNSLGGRVALELARRGRARSVVAIAPSGTSLPPERLYQAAVLSGARVLARTLDPVMPRLARSRVARTVLLTGLRAQPWRAGEPDLRAVSQGFGSSPDFWRQLFWALVADVPLGVREIGCPVTLVQGVLDPIAPMQTPRFAVMVPGSTVAFLPWSGHAPHSDQPGLLARLVRETAAAGDRSRSGPATAPPDATTGPDQDAPAFRRRGVA